MAYYEIGKMEQAARNRRERLLAMKKKMKNDANKTKKGHNEETTSNI